MARKSEREKTATWSRRLEAADKTYKKWSDRYKVKVLWEYYLGHQWQQGSMVDGAGNNRYTINLVFPTIETQLPSQLFYHPRFLVRPSPTMTETPGSQAAERAKLQEDTLNAYVRDSRLHFKDETFLSLLESYFAFGVIEVGYSADWIDNPNAGKPVLKENSDEPMVDSSGAEVTQPEKLMKRENIYFKRIPADQFRTSSNGQKSIERCDWVAYYEWQYPEDIKRNPRYKNTSNVKSTGKISADEAPSSYDNADDESKHRDMVKVWKIRDLRAKKRYDWGEGNEKFFLEEDMDEWEDGTPVVPFSVLQKNPRLNDFLPLPPVFNWLSPQDELNETREMQRIHRKRFLRKYIADQSIEDSEIAKFSLPDDGIIIRGRIDAIAPIADAPLDSTVVRNIPMTKDDFREISGVSAEDRGVAQADTATQAQIISNESMIRDTKARDQISEWLAGIGKLALYYLRKRMVMPFWIKMNVDQLAPGAPIATQKVVAGYAQIKAEDLDGVDTEVTVDVTSLAPVSEQRDRQDWITALQLLTDPLRGPMLLASDVLLRKTLGFFNIRSEQEIAELSKFGVRALQMLTMSQQQQAQPGGGAPAGPPPPSPGPTPDQGQIGDQLQAQLGVPQ